MKSEEVIALSVEDLNKKELELRNELVALRLKKQVGQVEKTHRFSEIKRDIARIETVKSERAKQILA